MHKGYPHSMMILAYLRTKLCSSKMNRERSLIPSRRSRRTNRLHRLSLGSAVAVARTRAVAVWSLPARVDRWRVAASAAAAPWQTPAVVSVEDLTTTSIASNTADDNEPRSGFTSQRAGHSARRRLALWRRAHPDVYSPRNKRTTTVYTLSTI